MRQVILDTETTGLDPLRGHRLTEIGCIEMINRRLTGRRFQTYLNPERELDKDAARITGLSLEFLKDKPKFLDIHQEFLLFLQEPQTELIIHNASFDLGFLNHELGLINHAWRPLEKHLNVIDTLQVARRLHPGQRNSLDMLCRRYNIDNMHRELHGALLDSELLAQVYLAMTAGQTSMALGNEANTERERHTTAKMKIQRIQRTTSVPLPIILANEQECRLHMEKLIKLQAKKDAS